MTVRSALEVATTTDAGVVRSFNEDTIATELDLGLAIVADGMGGYQAGDVASGMAASIMLDEVKQRLRASEPDAPTDILCDAVRKANHAIHQAARANPQYHGMGTTVVSALLNDNQIHFTHVGDSRLYRLRHGKLSVLTQDHSILHDQLAQGLISVDDAKTSHNRNLVTRALGIAPDTDCSAQVQAAESGDIYLLCSDGLNDMVDDADIELVLSSLSSNLSLAARQLVMIANDNGGHDNISVILIKIVKPFAAEEAHKGVMERLFGWWK